MTGVSETATQSLTAFLLARVSEDERAAEGAGSFTPWSEDFQRDNYGHLNVQPSRVLAECESKRAIVRLLVEAARAKDEAAAMPGATWLGQQHLNAAALACQYLATVYASHPDYRDEWA